MKKFNKIALLTIVGISIINDQTMARDNKQLENSRLEGIPAAPRGTPQIEMANTDKVVGVLVAAQVKSLEQLMFECVQKHIPNFSDLTISNVKSKKTHIENLRKDLLNILKNAEKAHRNQYKNLEKMLESLDINQVLKAIADFKEILKHLPTESSLLIKNNLKDSMTKRLLGF